MKELRNDLEETRAEIKVNNLSINAQLQELKSMIEVKTNAAPPPPCEPKPVMHVHHSKKATKEQYDGIRFRGIPELKTSNSRERYEHDLKQVKLITKHLNVTCNVTDLKRLGKFSEGKDRTLIAKIDSDYAKRLILLSLRKMKDYRTPVFISKELNPEEQKIENELLQKRREMLKNGINKNQIRIRNLKLQQNIDKKWVDIDSNLSNPSDNASIE